MPADRPLLLDVSRLIWRRWVGRHPTGIDRVCLAYLRRYGPQAQAVVQQNGVRGILPVPASDELFELLLDPAANFRSRFLRQIGRTATRFEQRHRGQDRINLNVGHTGLDRGGFTRWVSRARVRPVYMLHDLIPITHPEYCRAGEAARHERRVRTMLATGAGIIGNSQATLDSLAVFSAARDLRQPPSTAALLGSDMSAAAPIGRGGSDRPPTFVILGTIEARKNHLLLLQIWSRMAQALGPSVPRLLILGQRGWECAQVFELLDRGGTTRSAIVEAGNSSDADIQEHLRGARALLFPSLTEGFGLPLIEALNAGTPVIASDLPVFREIGGPVPDYLDPHDETGWERTILAYTEKDSAARAAQLARMKNWKPPTWDHHFATVDAFIGRL